MAATCGFSSGFSNGFDICVAEEREALRGIPLPPRQRLRRLRPVDLEGFGRIVILSRGRLSVDFALVGRALVDIQAAGFLSLVQALSGEAPIELEAPAALSAETSLASDTLLELAATGELSVAPLVVAPYVPVSVDFEGRRLLAIALATGRLDRDRSCTGVDSLAVATASGHLHRDRAFAGTASLALKAAGAVFTDRSLGGWLDGSPSVLGDIEADDEETALALLGIPSEVLV